MGELERMQQRAAEFRDERDWKKFHNPKDMALSLVLEAAEVMEHFQWKNPQEMGEYIKTNKADIADELADVLHWLLLMAGDFDIDLSKAFEEKMQKNEKKYPVEKAKGRHTKYDKL